MESKTILTALIGFFAGGLLVSVAATTFARPEPNNHSETTMSEMTTSLQDKTGDAYDKAFIAHMIEHHESAVEMAELSKQNAKHQEIKDLSEAIVKNQAAEINQMKQWQTDWGYDESGSHSKINH
jgi:uncharacterized protein (DUF305 family)